MYLISICTSSVYVPRGEYVLLEDMVFQEPGISLLKFYTFVVYIYARKEKNK